MSRRRVVLLDRDGTLIVDRHFLADPEDVTLLPGAVEGLRRLSALGLGLVVVSNQSGVGRGYFGLAEVERVNARMVALLAADGVRLDGLYYCAHAPEVGCACRKPKPGMVARAACEIGFDPARAYVIGDRDVDVRLGRALGATTLLVRRRGEGGRPPGAVAPDYVVADLTQAAAVLEALAQPEGG